MRQRREIESCHKNYIVDIHNFKVIQKIQNGAFGSVYLVENKNTGVKAAAKVISVDKNESQYKLMVNREIRIMIRYQHPSIIKFYGYSIKDFDDQDNVTIFMEYAEKGSLEDILQQFQVGKIDSNFTNTKRQIILIGIARGMMFLHQHNIIHRDLKPGNILLDQNYFPHICDFGCSKQYQKGDSMKQSQSYGTCIYMAPEVFEGTRYNEKADVYSFGILMYEVVTNSIPYPSLQKGKMKVFPFTQKVIEKNLRPKFEVPVKKSIKRLIKKCWSKNPSERPTFEEIFKKLAYNMESFEVNLNDEEEEELNEEDENNKFYLKDVNVEEILSYADDIDSNEDNIDEKIMSLINPIKEENEKLKSDLDELKNEIILLKEKQELQNHELQQKDQEIKELKNEITKLKKINNVVPYCTYAATANRHITQKWYYCKTCNLTKLSGICENCALKCHKNHDVEFHSNSTYFFCDCPDCCKCSIMPNEDETFECCSKLANGNVIEQPMYQCKSCNILNNDYLCQNCAIKNHKGHDLIYNGLVNGHICKNFTDNH